MNNRDIALERAEGFVAKTHRSWWQRLRSLHATLLFAFGFLSILIVAVTLADWIPDLAEPTAGYGAFHQSPVLTLNGLFGTDTVGRSMFSRMIYGGRISLTISVVATLIAMTLGITIGMLAGWYRGIVERVVDLYANTLAAVPPLLFLLALGAAVGNSLLTMAVALGITGGGMYCRISKGVVISHAQRDYVLAARALGASNTRILAREILPNLVPTLTAIVPPGMAALIVTEGSLSFLGYGIPIPAASWGGMIAASSESMNAFPYLQVGPILAIVLTVYALNTIGDYMAKRIDVREGQL